MDADLQNDPMDIPLLMAKADEGYDIVSGWRKNRQDRWLDRKLPSMLANRLISNVTDVRLHDYGCSLKAYRTEVLKQVRLYGELHRFIPALASQVGAIVTEVPVNHRARQFGAPKYGISRTIRVMLDSDHRLVSGRLFDAADPRLWHAGAGVDGGGRSLGSI
jgi:glycosyltransferase involved in cell wall biosynthesis